MASNLMWRFCVSAIFSVLTLAVLQIASWDFRFGTPTHAQEADFKALAEFWSPIIYQDVDKEKPMADYITRFNFDGDLDAANNWESLQSLIDEDSQETSDDSFSPDAAVYYWVVETKSHWFIGYAIYHPQDLGDIKKVGPFKRWSCLVPVGFCHENDLEGVLLTVRRASEGGLEFGDLQMMHTIAHSSILPYIV